VSGDGGISRSSGAGGISRSSSDPEPGTELERLEPHGTELGFPQEGLVTRYEPHFRLMQGALIGIAIGAVAAIALFLSGRAAEPKPDWSSWRPADRGTKGASQIADHVAPTYRLKTGQQLVAVEGGPLKVADLPVRIAMAQPDDPGTVRIVRGDGILYTLCGLGKRCSIATGKPSAERALLLRREALELALYTFRYLHGVDNVVALMPPAPGNKPDNALFFRRDNVEPALDLPLRATLPARPPTPESITTSPETGLVTKLTDPTLFKYSVQQAPDASAFLVLNRPTKSQ
jgi:hypothetical protein